MLAGEGGQEEWGSARFPLLAVEGGSEWCGSIRSLNTVKSAVLMFAFIFSTALFMRLFFSSLAEEDGYEWVENRSTSLGNY